MKYVTLSIDDHTGTFNFIVTDDVNKITVDKLLNGGVQYMTDLQSDTYFYTQTPEMIGTPHSLGKSIDIETAQCIMDYCLKFDLFPEMGHMNVLEEEHANSILGILSL